MGQSQELAVTERLVEESSAERTRQRLQRAVHRHGLFTRQGLRERLFTLAFRDLVYAQIWEDPVQDMALLDMGPGQHVVTIASGGCNVMSYLAARPARITAVDLNGAHVALCRLKIAAAQVLPDHASFYRFFGEANQRSNVETYERQIAPSLDAESRRYWEGRDRLGRRRIGAFARNFYRHGLLGRFITLGHALAKAHGVDPARMLEARDRAEQRAIFAREIAPIFDKPLIRWLVKRPASLYGLGIPPAQYEALRNSTRDGTMESVLRERLERLACGFDLSENYFAWQAFGRRYAPGGRGSVPPYLEHRHFQTIRENAGRVDVRHANFIDFLETQPAGSVDRFVLLDAQDWMSDAILTRLWTQITRTARPGARVLFRTADEVTLLPGRVPESILSRWHYDPERSARDILEDRSAIYGGVHLYTFRG